MKNLLLRAINIERFQAAAPRLLLVAVRLSVINHGMVVTTFLVPGTLLRDSLPPLSHFVVDPLAMVMNMIPLTPGGIGVA